jgi:hypothetical protein
LKFRLITKSWTKLPYPDRTLVIVLCALSQEGAIQRKFARAAILYGIIWLENSAGTTRTFMKKMLIAGSSLVFAVVMLTPQIASAHTYAQQDSTAKQDTKAAGSDTKAAAKKTGSATKNAVKGSGTAAKDDTKTAGSDTKDAAKKTGSATKKGTKKVVNKSAEKTEEGADKVKDKTKPN